MGKLTSRLWRALRRQVPVAIDPTFLRAGLGSVFGIHDLRRERRALNEAMIRSSCFSCYLGDDTALCRVLGRYKMFVDTKDRGLSVHLIGDGYWEMWHTEAMLELVRPGMKAVDIGANLGYFTLLMADLVGETGSVHAFEPNPALAARLRDTVEINGYVARTTIEQVALSDGQGSAYLVLPANQPKNGYLGDEWHGADGVRVTTVRFDALASVMNADYIKIDVEGAEEAVWRGMAALLESGRPLTIVLEFTSGRYADPAAFLDDILRHGFSLAVIEPVDGIVAITREQLLARPATVDQLIVLRR